MLDGRKYEHLLKCNGITRYILQRLSIPLVYFNKSTHYFSQSQMNLCSNLARCLPLVTSITYQFRKVTINAMTILPEYTEHRTVGQSL
jgi:hypothetical protein